MFEYIKLIAIYGLNLNLIESFFYGKNFTYAESLKTETNADVIIIDGDEFNPYKIGGLIKKYDVPIVIFISNEIKLQKLKTIFLKSCLIINKNNYEKIDIWKESNENLQFKILENKNIELIDNLMKHQNFTKQYQEIFNEIKNYIISKIPNKKEIKENNNLKLQENLKIKTNKNTSENLNISEVKKTNINKIEILEQLKNNNKVDIFVDGSLKNNRYFSSIFCENNNFYFVDKIEIFNFNKSTHTELVALYRGLLFAETLKRFFVKINIFVDFDFSFLFFKNERDDYNLLKDNKINFVWEKIKLMVNNNKNIEILKVASNCNLAHNLFYNDDISYIKFFNKDFETKYINNLSD